METYKLDRKTVSKATFLEADTHVLHTQKIIYNRTPKSGLFYYNNIYNVTPDTKIDKLYVTKRKHGSTFNRDFVGSLEALNKH